MVATLVAYRLAAKLGGDGLDAYILVRRTVSFLQPLLLLGLAVGLPRMVAMAQAHPLQRRYLLAAMRIVLIGSGAGVLFATLMPTTVARALLGDAAMAPVAAPLAWMVLGLCLHAVAYGYLRGAHRTLAANVLQVIGLAVVPLVGFAVVPDLPAVLRFTGLGWCGVALLFLLPDLVRGPLHVAPVERGALLRYGLPRIPGDLAYAALFTLPVLWAAHRWGLAAGGGIGLGVTLLNLMAAAFAPISILLLPQAARSIGTGDHLGLERRIARLERNALIVSVAAMVLGEVVLPWALELYLRDVDTAPYVPACRTIFLAAPALAYFVALRSVLDAYHTGPRNGVNILIALAVTVILLGVVAVVGLPAHWAGVALVVGMVVLAVRTRTDIAHVRAELLRRAQGRGPLRLLVVIPGRAEGNEMPFARRQACWTARETGAVVDIYFLEHRTSPTGLWRAWRSFRRRVREFRPDIVHAHYGTVTGLFTVLASTAPVVITFHGSDLNPTPTDGVLRDLLGRAFSQWAAFFAAGIICVSEGLRQRLWWRRDEARVLPMGVDLAMFRPMDRAACRAELGWSDTERHVIFNGNNPALKRLDLAERTVELLRARGVPVRLHVLQGGIEPHRMPVLLNAADALLLCSDREGSPTMVKEAMACGLPVVTNDVGDVRERLRDVRPGAVVAQDPTALADALESVLRGPVRSNGRELARRNGIDAEIIDRTTYRFLHDLVER